MIKKIFIAHILFMILCVLGIIASFLLALWEITSVDLGFKLGITFILGVFSGTVFMLVMCNKYAKEGLL